VRPLVKFYRSSAVRPARLERRSHWARSSCTSIYPTQHCVGARSLTAALISVWCSILISSVFLRVSGHPVVRRGYGRAGEGRAE
jgi:hypothetical protein